MHIFVNTVTLFIREACLDAKGCAGIGTIVCSLTSAGFDLDGIPRVDRSHVIEPIILYL